MARKNNNRTITFKADNELYYKIKQYARKLGISKSEFIRRAIEELIREYEKTEYIEEYLAENPVIVF